MILGIAAIAWGGPGFFEKEWVPRKAGTFPSYIEHPSSTEKAAVTVIVDFSDTVRKVLPTIFAHNANPWVGKELYKEKAALTQLRRLEISDMRLPGGNWSNTWMWDGTLPTGVRDDYAGKITGPPNQVWAMDTDGLIALCDSVGARPQPCVNYSLARYLLAPDRVEQAAGFAGAWVRDLNIDKGKGAKYWEVGNENYGPWQAGHTVSDLGRITGTEYGKDFCLFADSMHAADPTVKVGAVLIPDAGDYNNWSEGVLPEVQDHADYLIIHDYFTWAHDMNTITVRQVLDGITFMKSNMKSVESMVAEHTGKRGDHFPIALTEYNVCAGRKNNAMVANLFVTMSLGEAIDAGYGLVNIWDIANGGPPDGGDHGLLSRGTANVEPWTAHPTFFAYYYFGRFFGDVMVRTTNSDADLYCYASRFSTEEAGIVIVNPTKTAKTVLLALENFGVGDRAYWYTIKADGPEEWTIEINGKRGPAKGFGPDNFWKIAPYSAKLTAPFKFTAPAWSSNYILLESRDRVRAGKD